MPTKKHLRLLYLVPEFPSQTHAFFWREVQALRSRGVEVVLVSTRRPPDGACRHAFAKDAGEQTHYLFPPNWLSDSLFLLLHPVAAVKALRYVMGLRESSLPQRLALAPLVLPAVTLCRLSHKQSADHLHVHSFANAAHVAALAKMIGGCSFSLTLHGDLEVYGKDHVSKTRHAKFVTCVTAPLRRQVVERLALAESKVHLLWMGVDTGRFKPLEKNERHSSDPLSLLSVARLHINKGHRFALRAIKHLKTQGVNVRYTIVGDGPEKSAIEEEVRALELSDSVKLVGSRSETEVLDLLQSSDVLLLTSIGTGEAAPVAVMEAMACGLPVICSLIGGTRDMIDHSKDGFLVAQESVDDIAVCIEQLFDDPVLRLNIGKAARLRAQQQFDCYTLAKDFLSFIE